MEKHEQKKYRCHTETAFKEVQIEMKEIAI